MIEGEGDSLRRLSVVVPSLELHTLAPLNLGTNRRHTVILSSFSMFIVSYVGRSKAPPVPFRHTEQLPIHLGAWSMAMAAF